MGDRNATWIKLYRGIMNSSVWEDDKRLKAWIYILLETSYADRTKYVHGQNIKIKRGECFTSIRAMAKSIKCEPKTARRILEQFAENGMITFKIVPTIGTLITPLKYKDFQSGNLPDDYTDDTTDDITNDLTDDTTDDIADDLYESPHHKKDKNTNKKDKKGKKTPVPPSGGPADPWAWGGPKPARWNDDDEWSWRNDQSNPNNPRMTRMEIWKDWGESDE